MLWSVHWPECGTVEDFIKNFMGSLVFYLRKCSIYLIFDRYPPESIMSVTTSNRAGKNASRKHLLNLHTPLPSQKIVLSVEHNKIPLINLISKYLVDCSLISDNELIITSEDPIPVAIRNGKAAKRFDLYNTHEETDLIIVNQLVHATAKMGSTDICVVWDDTDVFVLLIHFYCREKLDCNVTMKSPIVGRRIIDIKTAVIKHKDIADNLPGMHALTGCDSTSYLYGIGKTAALKVLTYGKCLSLLGVVDIGRDENILTQATSFIATCYGAKCDGDLSKIRYDVWSSKMAKSKISCAPKLKSIPPTSDAFAEHVKRAHYQTIIWKSSLSSGSPLNVNPLDHGWIKKDG